MLEKFKQTNWNFHFLRIFPSYFLRETLFSTKTTNNIKNRFSSRHKQSFNFILFSIWLDNIFFRDFHFRLTKSRILECNKKNVLSLKLSEHIFLFLLSNLNSILEFNLWGDTIWKEKIVKYQSTSSECTG